MFILVIAQDGTFIRLEPRLSDRWKRGTPMLVPQAEIRSGKDAWKQPNLLWDHMGFVLGAVKVTSKGEPDPSDSPEKAARRLHSFRARILDLLVKHEESPGLRAIAGFYEHAQPARVIADPGFADVLRLPGANLTFRLVESVEPVCQETWLAATLAADGAAPHEAHESDVIGRCLVTAETARIARLHFKVSGVCAKPAALAAANTLEYTAYSSFGKEQGYNFPVSEKAAFEYTTALNHLLARDSRNRTQVGDASTVCWAQQSTDLETTFPDLFGEPPKDDPDRGVIAIKALYAAIYTGRLAGSEGDTRFFVLGLAPNAARIAVRFFHRLPLRDLAERIRQHFDDLAVVKGSRDPEHLSLFRLLLACAVLGKAENIPPNLGGAVVDAVLEGPSVPYPAMLLNAAVNRCRAERAVTQPRAAVIKACLNRQIRRRNHDKEFKPMLDTSNLNPAYRLGRLFAVLERIQEDSAGGPGKINATIRDRFCGAASSTPVAVFTRLLRLKNAHLKKLTAGRVIWYEKLIGEISSALDDFPPHLTLPDQGRFAIGYYHQRQAFFTKADVQPTATDNLGDH